jgi:hypothetical protein
MQSFGLTRDQNRQLVLIDSDGARHVGVRPVRAFPISESERFVSICDADGRELTFVEDLNDLPEATRALISEEINQTYFMPEIRRITGIAQRSDVLECEVETDRGPTRFQLTSDEEIRRFGDCGVLFVDTNRIRYRIEDLSKLDPASRRLLERYL